MKESIQAKSGRRRAPCPEEAALLDMMRTCDLLSRGPAQVLKTEELSATQYNVLRILRGAPQGLPCGEIANRSENGNGPDHACGTQTPGRARRTDTRGPSQAIGPAGTGATPGARRVAARLPYQSQLIFLADIFV